MEGSCIFNLSNVIRREIFDLLKMWVKYSYIKIMCNISQSNQVVKAFENITWCWWNHPQPGKSFGNFFSLRPFSWRTVRSGSGHRRATSSGCLSPLERHRSVAGTRWQLALMWRVSVCWTVVRTTQYAKKQLLFKSTIHHTSSLHNLLPPPREHPSITRLRVPSKFPRIPTRTKKYQSFFSHALSNY